MLKLKCTSLPGYAFDRKHKCYNKGNVRAQRYILILVIIIAIAGAVVGYYVWHNAHPASPKPHDISVGVQSNAAIARAADLARQQKYTEAIAVLEAVRTKTPYDQDKIDLGIAEGSIYIQAKDSVHARDVLLDTIKVKSDSMTVQFNLGVAAQQIADYDTAMAAFTQVSKLLTDKDSPAIKASTVTALAALPKQQAGFKNDDTELVRLMGRYAWYEVRQNKDAANAEYQAVAHYVASKNLSTDTVNALHQKVIQAIIANLSTH
jgi:tetratricopeptide (TPR) repeat protein